MMRPPREWCCSCAAAALLLAPAPRHNVIELPAGMVEVREETIVESGTEVRGAPAGTVLRMAPDFHGRAVFVAHGSSVRLRDFTIEGNRETRDNRAGLPPYDVEFARFTRGEWSAGSGYRGAGDRSCGSSEISAASRFW